MSMSSLVRLNFKSLVGHGRKHLCSKKDFQIVRTITSRITRAGEDRPPKPAPYPYNEKSFNMLHYFFDKTSSRMDENSKIVIVDGPVAAGKSKFAKELAFELDMMYLPEANLDMQYINSYGFDKKSLDPQLPESCKTFDVMDFLKNPMDFRVARFQIEQYLIKFSQYIDALAHLFSTGQGLVLDRSAFSDFVFVEAMYSRGYLSKKAYKKYYEFRDNTIQELLRPHLVIYLDVPVPKVMENIKKRAISYEANSPALTPEYLSVMEKQYKQHYLKDISNHAELLVYDWSEEGDIEVIVEDIERINFNYDEQDSHSQDWDFPKEEDYAVTRYRYCEQKNLLMNYSNVPAFEVPELMIDAEEKEVLRRLYLDAPGEKYEKGFNKDMGDSNILFKINPRDRGTLPLRERRI